MLIVIWLEIKHCIFMHRVSSLNLFLILLRYHIQIIGDHVKVSLNLSLDILWFSHALELAINLLENKLIRRLSFELKLAFNLSVPRVCLRPCVLEGIWVFFSGSLSQD